MDIKSALISVTDKTDLALLVPKLNEREVQIYASGGTFKKLKDLGAKFLHSVDKLTGAKELFNGRVKTLSGPIFAGILSRRTCEDKKLCKEEGIVEIDLVICNLYDFKSTMNNASEVDVEAIDIGGVSLLRAAAKNFEHVVCLSSPSQYGLFLDHFCKTSLKIDIRKKFAFEAFKLTSYYDSLIEESFGFSAKTELRYGENPHQVGFFSPVDEEAGISRLVKRNGKELSYNNYLDIDSAMSINIDLHREFPQMAICSIVKHGNPCGVSIEEEQVESFKNAFASDPVSNFGSIVCFNSLLDEKTAYQINEKFIEVVICPDITEKALEILSMKKNLRVLSNYTPSQSLSGYISRSVNGGMLSQEVDGAIDYEFQLSTNCTGFELDTELAKFSTICSKHLKSNAISIARRTTTGFWLAGAGMGNPNRLVSISQAINKCIENGITDLKDFYLSSDAFFPFEDNIKFISDYGIKTVIQPGGSIRDRQILEECKIHNINMVLTGTRHFLH